MYLYRRDLTRLIDVLVGEAFGLSFFGPPCICCMYGVCLHIQMYLFFVLSKSRKRCVNEH